MKLLLLQKNYTNIENMQRASLRHVRGVMPKGAAYLGVPPFGPCHSEWEMLQWTETVQEAQLLLRDRATQKPASYWDTGRGNDNLDWNDLQVSFEVIKSVTNRKLVYDFPLVLCNNFCRINYAPFSKNLEWRITSFSSVTELEVFLAWRCTIRVSTKTWSSIFTARRCHRRPVLAILSHWWRCRNKLIYGSGTIRKA